MADNNTISINLNAYNGNVSEKLIEEAVEAYNDYKSDKEHFLTRIRDDERYYNDCYNKTSRTLKEEMNQSTSFIISAIENYCADASESYPEPNILEREKEGVAAAEALSKLVPVLLDRSGFRKTYKKNNRNKAKFGTSIYGVFYDEATGEIDIRDIHIRDIYVDMHIENIQDSQFLFIPAVVDNSYLKERYPEHKELFDGDTEVESLYREDYKLKNKSTVIDCYYKKPDGSVHMMKWCNSTILSATEDMKGYENGIYAHGKYPVVFDKLYPDSDSPFGFGFIDLGKPAQLAIDKLDRSITRNILTNSAPRVLTKKNANINKEALMDVENCIVEYEGDIDSVKPLESTQLNSDSLTFREYKKDELKELLANRDFQQGGTAGGVVAASAIQALQQSGEKRARSIISDTYDAYKEIVTMVIEIIRQFYNEPRSFRTKDANGRKSFMEFSNAQMNIARSEIVDNGDGTTSEAQKLVPAEFDVEVAAQKENPYTREMLNETLLALWNGGVMSPENADRALILLKSMSFDGKETLVSELQDLLEKQQQTTPEETPTSTPTPAPAGAMMPPQAQPAPAPDINTLMQGGNIL